MFMLAPSSPPGPVAFTHALSDANGSRPRRSKAWWRLSVPDRTEAVPPDLRHPLLRPAWPDA